MRRREFLVRAATAVAASAPALRAWARGEALATVFAPGQTTEQALPASGQAGAVSASLASNPNKRIAAIPRDFTGLSYESAQLANPQFFSRQNTGLIAFVRTLGKNGVLRIGGNTSEFTRWVEHPTAADQVPLVAGPDTGASRTKPITPITPDAIRNLAGFLDAIGWRLLYGLNMGTGTPERAATEASLVHKVMGTKLIAFQIGNEPDIYTHSRLRPRPWTFDDYLAEWKHFAKAVRHRVRKARFAAPDTADKTEWVVSLAEQAPKEIIMLTQHYYAEGPPRKPEMNIDRLLHPNQRFDGIVARIQEASRSSGLPFRLSETNSCYNGGKEGVSDTFASALWGGDVMFQIASAGQIGINFHGGGNGIYTPIAGSAESGFSARPIYYGMLLFKQAIGGEIVESHFDAGGANATAYAVRLPDNALGVAVFNKDVQNAIRVSINAGAPVQRAGLLRLAAPAIDAKTGVTFGGAAVSPEGAWAASQTETPEHTESGVAIDLPASSAAWVRIE